MNEGLACLDVFGTLSKIPDSRLAGSVWQSFAAADWVDFDDIEERFQQVWLFQYYLRA
jgi:hypothetical protein